MQGWAGRGRKSASGHADAAAFLPKFRRSAGAVFPASLIAWLPTQALAQEGERLTRLADLGFLTDEPRGIFSTAFVVGLTIFSITVAVLHIRARDFWTRRLRALSDRAAETETSLDRTKLFLNAERQVFVVWAGENEPAVIEGDQSFLGAQANVNRLLAFGAWLAPDRAAAIEARARAAAEPRRRLRPCARNDGGQSRGARARGRRPRRDALARDDRGPARAAKSMPRPCAIAEEADSLRALLEARRVPRGCATGWAGSPSSIAPMCARSRRRAAEDVVARGLELLDEPIRERSERLLREGAAFPSSSTWWPRANAALFDVADVPTAAGSAGVALDVTDLEAVGPSSAGRRRRTGARSTSLPTAVGDLRRHEAPRFLQQRLSRHVAA